MDNKGKGQLENRLSQGAKQLSKRILTVLESNMLGRVRGLTEGSPESLAKLEITKEEYLFLRKCILDYINDYMRAVGSILNNFNVERKETFTLNIGKGEEKENG